MAQDKVKGSATLLKVKILEEATPLYVMEYTTSAAVQVAEVTVNLLMFKESVEPPIV